MLLTIFMNDGWHYVDREIPWIGNPYDPITQRRAIRRHVAQLGLNYNQIESFKLTLLRADSQGQEQRRVVMWAVPHISNFTEV